MKLVLFANNKIKLIFLINIVKEIQIIENSIENIFQNICEFYIIKHI